MQHCDMDESSLSLTVYGILYRLCPTAKQRSFYQLSDSPCYTRAIWSTFHCSTHSSLPIPLPVRSQNIIASFFFGLYVCSHKLYTFICMSKNIILNRKYFIFFHNFVTQLNFKSLAGLLPNICRLVGR